MNYLIGFIAYSISVILLTVMLDFINNRGTVGNSSLIGTAINLGLSLAVLLGLFLAIGFEIAGKFLLKLLHP